jgi:hypothetical protein
MSVTINGTTGITTPTPIAVGSGGTGSTTLTANNVLLGNGTSALQAVAPGTSGNVLTSNGTTWTSAAAGGLGVGQTWQDMAASRAFNTTYTNSTGKPIAAVIVMGNVGTSDGFALVINGVSTDYVYTNSSGGRVGLTYIIPDGNTYRANNTGAGTFLSWIELR